MKTIEGDLLKLASQGRFDVIIHGCNCFCTMGAGIAKSIRDQYPAAYEADLATNKGSRDKLGTYSSADVTAGEFQFTVVNAYTQFNYRGSGAKADYDAIREVFRKIQSDFTGKRIGYPMLGAGLAGGDWDTISSIIDQALDGEDHTLVVLNPS
ncbi:macro domain-containing protein [Stieleria sp. ICT_E10.1]|uniref:macro domain-containing protein n=1 Tax=Stieleria sedimenti TaxID=2976331 RepID=UPI00217FCCD7|nr:macro domain-containing protein [Stieleria sedimenti]MCS7470036.1 macro domain-containing protein [Stieleria sedimenti]